MSVLSRALGGQVKGTHSSAYRFKKLIRNGAKKKRAEASLISASLEGLHKVSNYSALPFIKILLGHYLFFFKLGSILNYFQVATLSNTLALQRLASSILTLLCNNVCNEKTITLSTDHALSLDVLLTGNLKYFTRKYINFEFTFLWHIFVRWSGVGFS